MRDLCSMLPLKRALLALLLVTAAGCTAEYDFSRQPRQLGTLGQEAHAILLKDAPRAAHAGPQKEALLQAREQEFVTAVDTIAPQQSLAMLDLFLQGTLSLMDSGLMPGMTRKASRMIQEASQDQELLAAMGDATLPQPADFVSPIAAPDLLGYITTYPDLRDLGIKGTRLVLDNDGFTDAGEPDPQESNGMSELMRTLASALQELDPQRTGDSLAIIVRDLLLRPDDRFASSDATRPLLVALYDARGLPMANPEIQSEFFLDLDQDGLPDLDANGDFMLKRGGSLPKQAFARMDGASRDAFGRAKSAENTFAFQYIDLDKTALAFLVREYAQLSEQGVVADLLATFRLLMGPTVIHQDERGPYRGFAKDNPLMDLSWGLSRALAYPQLPELASSSAEFVDVSSEELAGVVVALDKSVAIAERYPDAQLADTQTLLNDLIPTLHEIASDKALWHDFMNALGDPVTPRVGEAMSTLLSYKNTRARVTPNGPYDRCFQQCRDTQQLGTNARFDCIRACPNDEIFQQPMDFSAPESPENRSQLQATWHLMWSLSGVPYDMALDEVKIGGKATPQPPVLISLPGGAEAFLASVAGNLDLADAVPPELFTGEELGPLLSALGAGSNNIAGLVEVLSTLFGVQLSRKPTPDQLTRMFTLDDIAYREGNPPDDTVIDIREPRDAEGYRLADNLADGLFEAEASGLIDAVYPMSKAFSDHGKEHLLLELFAVVHKHYPGDASLYKTANGQISPSQAANLRSFEPVMKEIFEDGTLLKALFDLSNRLQQLEGSRGLELNEQLRLFILHATTPDELTTRDGLDYIQLPDGRTQRHLTPLHILVDALNRMVLAVQDDPEAEARFKRAMGALIDLALKAEWPENGRPHFTKPGSVALTSSTLSYLADLTKEKRDAGTLDTWLKEDIYATLDELWTSRLIAGLVLIAEQVLTEPENRATIDAFISYLVGTPRGREHTTLIAYQLVVRSVNTSVWVPIARTLSKLLDPDRDWQTKGAYARMPMTSQGALMLHEIMLQDEQGTGIALMNRALYRPGEQEAPIFVLVDLFAQYLRLDPSSSAPLSTEDYRFIFEQLAAWLSDDAKGMEQMYDLVELRAD